jgi:hypothetical protein
MNYDREASDQTHQRVVIGDLEQAGSLQHWHRDGGRDTEVFVYLRKQIPIPETYKGLAVVTRLSGKVRSFS